MTRDEYYGALYRVKSELAHHGIDGMHWGVRNGPPYLLKSSSNPLKMNIQFFAKRSKSYKTPKLSNKEITRVMSELMTNISKEQKELPTFHKPIGDFTYTFENHFDDTYRIIGKKKIPQSDTGLLERTQNGKNHK